MVQERPFRIERRLSAILAADVAGYSRLMHHDEEATHAKLRTLLADDVEPAITEHGGRIVKNTGDGLLAEFPSAVEAVRAALQFQTRIRELTNGDAESRRIAFRVGVNIGDVIVEPHDIFGDGVNIAARLESIAEPGGVCISSAAYDHVRGKVGVEFADLGEHNLKNIDRPVRVYAVVREGSSSPPAEYAKSSAHSPPRLSIVVLPFTNLSGGPEQDYFIDGVTESLISDLSRISGSFVIARSTAFTFKGKDVDVQKVGRELNVRYVLEGSVQRGGNRLRVNVQLIDVETASHLWAERFDKPIADLFDMQDEIVCRLANTLNAQLIEAEARRAARSLHPDAIDLSFQGNCCFNKGFTAEHMAQAREFYERALVLDPENTEALVGIAAVDAASAAFFIFSDREARFAAAEAALIKALSISPQHARAHMYLGAVQCSTKRAAQGIRECERALALDRNLADAHGIIGSAKVLIGRGTEAEGHIEEAFRLSPRDPIAFRWMFYAGLTKLILGADVEAVAWLRRCLEANRNYPIAHFQLAAALALLGSMEEARAAAKAGFELDPTFNIRRTRGRISDDPTFVAGSKRVREGMRLAGVPEG
ncbi:TolB-like protein/class 3 adenylate cyclase/Tfp pilus assembly protein PilF [Bradyrhizobium sp. AZCC 1610]|uniref:adenylate/guanylate cyclase domain-containing protein n=1 Tax=Bradyrhizobium sp. AZCC 1610 TaxID=3117020 RepID=UPI002FEE6B81